MARAAVLVLIGVLLLIAIIYLVSKMSDGLKGQGGTIGRILLLLVIAAMAFWYFGEGLLVQYLNP
jgi:hypothetical protein